MIMIVVELTQCYAPSVYVSGISESALTFVAQLSKIMAKAVMLSFDLT